MVSPLTTSDHGCLESRLGAKVFCVTLVGIVTQQIASDHSVAKIKREEKREREWGGGGEEE